MAEPTMEEVINLEEELLPCDICGRTFLPGSLKKHTSVCERNAKKKRTVFDSQKQRVEGTEIASFQQPSQTKKQTQVSETPKKVNKWKERHLELVNTIRTARNINATVEMSNSGSTATFHNPTLATGSSDRCLFCDRQFGPRAFDRHVEWCKERTARVKKSPADVMLAKERLAARTKYKVPLPIKSKRTVVKEKYSPTLENRTDSFSSTKSRSCVNLDRVTTTNKFKSVRQVSDISVHDGANATDLPTYQKLDTRRNHGDRSLKEKKSLPEDKSALDLKSPRPSRLLLLKNKINTVEVNTLESITVSHLSNSMESYHQAKRLVTWKDTINNDVSNYNTIDRFSNISEQEIKISNENRSEGFIDTKIIKYLLVPNLTKLPVRKMKNTHPLTSKMNSIYARQNDLDGVVLNNVSIPSPNLPVTSSQNREPGLTSEYNDDSKLIIVSNEEKLEGNSKLIVTKPIRFNNFPVYKSIVTMDNLNARNNQFIDSDENNRKVLVTNLKTKRTLQSKLPITTTSSNTSTEDQLVFNFTLACGKKCRSEDIEDALIEDELHSTCLPLVHTENVTAYISEENLQDLKTRTTPSSIIDLKLRDPTNASIPSKAKFRNLIGPSNKCTNLHLKGYIPSEKGCNLLTSTVVPEKNLSDYAEEVEINQSENLKDCSDVGHSMSFTNNEVGYNKLIYDEALVNSGNVFQVAKRICEIERYTSDCCGDTSELEQSTDKDDAVPNKTNNKTNHYQFDNENIEEFSGLTHGLVDQDDKNTVLITPQKEQPDLNKNCDESNIWNVALNLARLEQPRRNCSSAIHVQNKSVDNYFVTLVETNLEQFGKLSTEDDDELCGYGSLANSIGECVPRKRRKLIDKATVTVPIHTDSETSLNKFDSNLIKNCKENNSTKLVKTLASCIPRTEVNCYHDQHNVEKNHLVTLSTKDCRHLFELDPMSIENVNAGSKLPRIRLKKKTKILKQQNVDDLKISLPPISKFVVTQKNSTNRTRKISTSTLPEITVRSGIQHDYSPFLTAERQLMELLECDDFKPFFNKQSSTKPTHRPHTVNIVKTNQNKFLESKTLKSAENSRKNLDVAKRTSVLEPPSDFQDGDDFEIIESLINQNFLEGNEFHTLNNTSNKIFSESLTNLLYPFDDCGNNSLNKNSQYNDDITTIDPRLINEYDNLAIPKTLNVDSCSSSSSNDHGKRLVNVMDGLKINAVNLEKVSSNIKPIIRNTRLNIKKLPKQSKSKSSLSLNSSFLSNNIGSDKKKSLNTVKRSVSIREAPNKSNLKTKKDVDHYINQQEKNNTLKPNQPKHPEGSEEINSPKTDDLFSINDEMYEEYKIYEQLYLKEKHLHDPKTEITVNNVTDCEDAEFVGRCNFSKSCTDSAYSSLNRSNPKIRSKLNKLNPLEYQNPNLSPDGSSSSSSSEIAKNTKKNRMSKFCHECGCKYPIDTVKFCVDCGTKRLVL